MAVSKRLRMEVFRRDNHTCQYCGGRAPNVELTIDHVIPTTLGGTDVPENLVAACKDCNAGKSATAPDAAQIAAVPQATLRWQQALKQAAELAQSSRAERETHRAAFREEWSDWVNVATGLPVEIPNGWEATVDRLVAAGLTDADLVDAIRLALGRRLVDDKLAYFAGICWRWVSERQEMARQILEQEQQPDAEVPAILPAEDDWHWPPAPQGTRWIDDVLVDAESLKPIHLPKVLLFLDGIHTSAYVAKASYPDITVEEVLWGYPRYYSQIGVGVQHRMNALIAEYDLNDKSVVDLRSIVLRDIEAGFAEAAA